MDTNFRAKLINKERQIGIILSLPSTEIAEILSNSGFDWLFVDLEHGSISISDAQRILQASTIPCILRCPSHDKVWINKCLDIGASGLIFPMVNSKSEAEQIILHSKYPPIGNRGLGVSRAHGYGKQFESYISNANQSLVNIIQIERIDGVNNIESILEVDGIDCVFVGPYDLSASMNLTGQVDHPELIEAINKVINACKMKGMPLGVFASSAERIISFEKMGFTLLTASMDTILISNAASQLLTKLKEE